MMQGERELVSNCCAVCGESHTQGSSLKVTYIGLPFGGKKEVWQYENYADQ